MAKTKTATFSAELHGNGVLDIVSHTEHGPACHQRWSGIDMGNLDAELDTIGWRRVSDWRRPQRLERGDLERVALVERTADS